MATGGLANVGSTCYINTCIQCLGYCSKFREFVLSKRYTISKNSLMTELEEIYRALWIDRTSLIPRKFIKSLKDTITMLEINEQNDIGEFMILYLDKLNESICYKLNSPPELFGNISYNKKNVYESHQKKMDDAWFSLVSKEYSGLIPIIYGQCITQIICGHCEKIHHNYEMISMLTLPISKSSETLGDCIKHYFKEEYLNTKETNEWTCDKCSQKAKSLKTVLLWRNPEILILCLKRFTDDLKKNNKNLRIPDEFDLGKFSLDKTSSRYRICSVGNHLGSYFGGHYNSLCKTEHEHEHEHDNDNNNWYLIDDLDVSEVKNQGPDIGQGYVYFYQRY
jgi:ubiquitin C-terminal hydrolase